MNTRQDLTNRSTFTAMTDLPPPEPPRLPPAGWYPDPEHEGQRRWWDGTKWGAPSLAVKAKRPSTTPTQFSEVLPWLGNLAKRQPVVTALVVMAAAIVIAGVVTNGVSGGEGGSGDSPSVATVEDGQVMEVCHNRVLDHLKAPSTADFGGDVVGGSEPRFTDAGWVDAENSYGAKIRTAYTCIAIHTGGINFDVQATLAD